MDMLENFMVSKKRGAIVIILLYIFLSISCSSSGEGVNNMRGGNNNVPKDTIDMKGKFTTLYNDWQEYINRPNVKVSSRSEDYIKCKPYNEIIKLGKPVLPHLVEKLKEGKASNWHESQFFLWHAIKDITGTNLAEYEKFLPEQQIAEKYIIWWQKQ